MKSGYKQTEAGTIPDDWEVRDIRSVCKLINGRGFKPFEWKTSGLPIIRIQNLNGSDEFNYFDGSYDRKLEVSTGQLLFAWSGSRGTSFGPHLWLGPLGLLNYHTWRIQVDNYEINPAFFFHALKKLTEFIEGRAHGASALVHVQKWEMEGFTFPAPRDPLEQRAIASALSDVDALLSGLDRLLAKKRDLKQATIQQLLTGQTRLPGFLEEWEVKRLGEVVTFQRGHDLPQHARRQGPIPIISSAGITDYHDIEMVSPPGVITGRYGTIGKLFFVTEPFWPLNTTLYVSDFHGNDPKFVFYLLQRFDFHAFSGKSGVPGVNRNDLHSELVLLPNNHAEQLAIATVLSDMDTELAALEARREKTRLLKQGMMQELLTGKTRLITPERDDA